MKFQPNQTYSFRGFDGRRYDIKVINVRQHRVSYVFNDLYPDVSEIKVTESGQQYIEQQYGIVFA